MSTLLRAMSALDRPDTRGPEEHDRARPARGAGAGGEASAGTEVPAGLAQVDARLADLENTIGTSYTDVPLSETLARVEQQMSLLTNTRHLDTIRQRAKLVSAELDRVAESRKKLERSEPGAADALPQDTLARIEQLHALQAQIEPLIPLAPALLSRMQSLAPLHASASSLAARVATLEHADAERSAQRHELEQVLSGAKSSLEENIDVMRRNVDSLEGRLAAADARLAAVGR